MYKLILWTKEGNFILLTIGSKDHCQEIQKQWEGSVVVPMK